ncbi:uncharacterized protein THITE_2122731 [Thermothielavioides terrestris NRRL 8126]|uniref:Uncharacterized protein n=1 Tax=Thermothielavioides terrestris (strain ATCC 38088 / NRRL 8126) TaxID=578455 RepID=G2RE05_THETT|nr:uncharacterized protein THITE_2122731 [Thermothielavioides terrestris NRRL 8126]AEO70888.1 hypothetical protein THITE_2122731 [Thermothielavioides terrestris NRRL 8126]
MHTRKGIVWSLGKNFPSYSFFFACSSFGSLHRRRADQPDRSPAHVEVPVKAGVPVACVDRIVGIIGFIGTPVSETIGSVLG